MIEILEGRLDKRYYDFNKTEIRLLIKSSDQPFLLDYKKTIDEMKDAFDALWFEIENTHGTWNKKNKILPRLFLELNTKLNFCLKKIIDFENRFPIMNEWEYEEYENIRGNSRFHKKNKALKLLNYLMNKISEDYPAYFKYNKDFDKLFSDEFTHNLLEKTLRIMRRRFENAMEFIIDYVKNRIKFKAEKSFSSLIIEKIEHNYNFPYFSSSEEISKTISWEFTVRDYDEFFDGKILKERIKKAFEPDTGNSELWIGLEPIWQDMPGKGYATYYFSYNPKNIEESKKNSFIIILKKAKSPIKIQGMPVARGNEKTWMDILKELQKEELFKEWFYREPIKKIIVRELTKGFRWDIEDLDKKKIILEDLIEKSIRTLPDDMKLFENYYGIIYSLEEIREGYEKFINEYYDRVNIGEDPKKRFRENSLKLFPIDEIKAYIKTKK